MENVDAILQGRRGGAVAEEVRKLRPTGSTESANMWRSSKNSMRGALFLSTRVFAPLLLRFVPIH